MSTVKTTYEEINERVNELQHILDAIRSGDVDTIVSEKDPSHLLVVREYELDQQKERQLVELQAILETMPTALVTVRPQGEICLCNQAFCSVGCIDFTKLPSCNLSCPGRCTTLTQWAARLQTHAEFLDELKQYLAESLEGSRQSSSSAGPLEATFKTDAGKQLHWLMTFRQLPGEIGGRPAVIIAGTDITDEKRLIRKLSDAKSQMEAFLAAAAHDLKAPLFTINHNLAFARMSLGEHISSEAAECLDRVQSAAKGMQDLLARLAQVSRAGSATEPRKLHSLRALAQLALRQLEGLLAERRANVIIAEEMPDLYCEENKMVQVFSNLISNAIKYTSSERTPRLEIGYRQRPDLGHVFFVRDNGIGIPEENLRDVFEPFRRLCSDPNTSGQGLGLSIVDQTIALHGGQVWAESVAGEGSTFYFSIPQRKEDNHGYDN